MNKIKEAIDRLEKIGAWIQDWLQAEDRERTILAASYLQIAELGEEVREIQNLLKAEIPKAEGVFVEECGTCGHFFHIFDPALKFGGECRRYPKTTPAIMSHKCGEWTRAGGQRDPEDPKDPEEPRGAVERSCRTCCYRRLGQFGAGDGLIWPACYFIPDKPAIIPSIRWECRGWKERGNR